MYSDQGVPLHVYPSLISVTFGLSLLPYHLLSYGRDIQDENKKIRYGHCLSCLTMFLYGLLLSLALMEFFPDVVTNMRQLFPKAIFPVGEFFVAVGMVLMLIIDQVKIHFKDQQIDTRTLIERLDRPSPQPLVTQPQPQIVGFVSDTEMPVAPGVPDPEIYHAIVLFLSVMFHSLFDGLILTQSKCSVLFNVTAMFFPLLIQKMFVGFTLGLCASKAGVGFSTIIVLCFIFSSLTSLGIAIAVYLGNSVNLEGFHVHGIIIGGISCGCFLYIICFQLIPKEFQHGRTRLCKVLMTVIGFTFGSILLYIMKFLNNSCSK